MQLIKVTSLDHTKPEGCLLCYEKSALNGSWREIGPSIPVLLGRNGVTHDKREGDGKTPLGTFSLGTVFGDATHKVHVVKYPYLTLSEGMEWVDDPASSYYNQLIRADFSDERNWTSSEKMWEMGALYALGVVVEYNTHPVVPGKGSAIFMHVQAENGLGTAGCISMKESDLCKMVAWLDPSKNPKIELD